MPGYIHHIQWCVSDLRSTREKMIKSFGFRQTFVRVGLNTETVIENGSVRFLISERGEISEPTRDRNQPTEYPWLNCKCRDTEVHSVDSVFNVCLEVGDVDAAYRLMTLNGSNILQAPATLRNKYGEVRVAVVSSPCANVIHSLVNTEHFSGGFLPGFSATEPEDKVDTEDGLSIDHVTYVCEVGESKPILTWYNQCCGMERFMVNTEDHPENGIEIKDEAGMRMMVGEWLSEWMCREEGVSWEEEGGAEKRNFKLVLAEPLPNHEHSHVYNFIKEHEGPGLQHIGLLTHNIIKTISTMKAHGAKFRNPPPTYYTLEDKRQDIFTIGSEPKHFQDLGILIDKARVYNSLCFFNISSKNRFSCIFRR